MSTKSLKIKGRIGDKGALGAYQAIRPTTTFTRDAYGNYIGRPHKRKVWAICYNCLNPVQGDNRLTNLLCAKCKKEKENA